MTELAIVIGAATPPGRLANAVEGLASSLRAGPHALAPTIVDLATAGVEICDGRPMDGYAASTREAVAAIEGAAAVLFAAPVYRASFPGVLKNLLDLLPVGALRDKPVGILAIGGSPHHYLAVDGHLRMVLAWFGALAMPTSVYLTNRDFTDGRLASEQAAADMQALADGLLMMTEALAGRSIGPAPLAAKYF